MAAAGEVSENGNMAAENGHHMWPLCGLAKSKMAAENEMVMKKKYRKWYRMEKRHENVSGGALAKLKLRWRRLAQPRKWRNQHHRKRNQ
jgi:hypothetical protein